MDRYRAAATPKAIAGWGDADELISGDDAEQAAMNLVDAVRRSGCDTVNVRVHLRGLDAEQVEEQVSLHRERFVPLVRAALAEGCAPTL